MTDLATLLADPAQAIAFVVELSYRDPDTDTDSTVRITSENWEGAGESGYLRGLLDDPGDQAVVVEVEAVGGIAKASLDPMRFLNQPPSIGAVGPLDFLRTKTLGGRAVTLYAGAPDEAIANYEQLGSGLADGEPEFDDEGGYVTLRRKTALDLMLQDVDIGTYVGEPGALRGLTSTAVSSTSYNAAYDLTEFTLAGRIWIDSFGASGANSFGPLQKISGSNINFLVAVHRTSTTLRVQVSSGGVNIKTWTSNTSLVTGRWYNFVFGFRSGYQYLMLDGAVEDDFTSTATPDTPAVGVTMNPSGVSGLGRIGDLRILRNYIPPDEARAWMATRATGDEEGLVGLWRGDDATGSTLTDYSPTAAHATISGTEGVDFEHVSSDLGEPEIAGQSMSMIVGGV